MGGTHNLSRLDWLREELDELTDSHDKAKDAESWQAVASLSRHKRVIRAEIDQYMAENGEDDPDNMSEDQYTALLAGAASEMPEEHLRIYVDEWTKRHGIELTEAPGTH